MLASSAQWQNIGALSLNGKSSGQLLPFAQIPGVPAITIMLQADLLTTPTGRLLINVGPSALISNSDYVLSNGQVLTITVPVSSQISWGLVSAANAIVAGGANDYLRATAYL